MPFPVLAMIKAVYTFMGQGRTEALAGSLLSLTQTLYSALVALRNESTGNHFDIPTSCPNSPIVPLFTHRPRELALYCQNESFNVRAIVAPTVTPGSERVRICLHSGNTVAEVANFVSTLRSWAEKQSEDPHPIHKAQL